MAMRDKAAEDLLQELAKAGVLDERTITGIRYQDLQLKKRDQDEMTVQEVIDRVDVGQLRSSEFETFSNIVSNAGGDAGDYAPSFMNRLSDMFSGESSFADTTGGVWAGEEGEPTLPESLKAQEIEQDELRQVRKDFVRTLDDLGYDVDITHLGPSQSVEELVDRLTREYDIPPAILDGVADDVEVMAMTRGLTQEELEELQAEEEAIDTTNVENPTFAKNLKAFQILDKNSPTKYQFDQATGAIYLTETGGQVDRRGEVVQPMSEEAAALVGGWPDDIPPVFVGDPTATGWGQMSVETGMQVKEADYYDVLDVINNKEWYGQDASRYVTGQPFLGGFDSGYRVKVEETDIMARTKATFDTLGGTDYLAERALGPAVWGAMQGDMQDTRRPWYDPNDNWAEFAGLSSENIAAVQSRMVAVGAINPDEMVQGVWGPTEAQQMHKWMTIANGQAIEWQDVDEGILREYFDEETRATSPRAAFVPQAFRPMDPATVELTLKDSVRAMVGRDPTDEDMQVLGGYLTEQYSSSYAADVAAGRSQYNAQVSADESGAEFAQPGAVGDVDWESRFMLEMEDRFTPQLESQERGALAGKQQDMGTAMSNMMGRLGGGIG